MRLVIIGCGGHGRVILDIAQRNRYQVLCFLDDDPLKHGKRYGGVIVKGPTSLLGDWPLSRRPQGIAVAVGDNHRRARIFAKVRSWGFKTPNIIHPQAIIGTNVELKEGDVVMAGAVINPGTQLGSNVCVNTGVIIDHDCLLRDHCHIFPGVTLTGGVEVGQFSSVGSGAVVNPYVKVGRDAFIGSGAVVVRNVPDGLVVVGVPAKKLKSTAELRR